MIINGKKVSLTHYLNKELKSYIFEGARFYQLYTTVNYKTKTTRFKAFRSLETKGVDRVLINEKHEDAVNAQDIKGIAPDVYEADNMVMRIIEHEIERFGDKFTLKGFGKRLDVYGKRIEELYHEFNPAENGLTPEARIRAKDGIQVLTWIHTPTVYDWIFADGKKNFEKQMQLNVDLAIEEAITKKI